MPYNCTLNSNSGCYDRTNLTICGVNEQCLNGTCSPFDTCTSDAECGSDTCYNGQFRDYYCDIGSSTCNYTDITIEETGTYCFDRIDNDCDGDVDDADIGCGDCGQTDTSCGTYPDCQNCNTLDKCYGDESRDYYCSPTYTCQYNYDNCSDCSCTCGGYSQEENQANENCNDRIDNDCDGDVDGTDSECQNINQYVSYWKFEGNLLDEKGINNGEQVGVINYTRGISGKAILIDKGNHVNISDSDTLDIQNELTISLWVNKAAYINHGKVITKRFSYANENPWEIYSIDFKGNSPGYPCFLISNASAGGQDAICDSESPIPLNEWHHLAAVYNQGEMSLFVDGNLKASKTTQVQIGENDMPLTIGAGNTGYYTNGMIDEVMIFNKALTETEITEIYESQNPEVINSLSPFTKFWEIIKNWIS